MHRQDNRSTGTWIRRWSRRIGALLLVSFLGSLSLVLPLRWLNPVTSSFMLQDDSGREPVLYTWVSQAQLGDAPTLAVVAAEDQKFADHAGFDLQSIRDSIDASAQGKGMRGASTISQQVAKNLFLWSGRSFLRKGLEAYLTVLLELCLPKRRIVEIYLNIAQFGPGIYGVDAASHHFFAKQPGLMSDSEAALLAAVLPNPVRFRVDAPSDYVRERQRWILGQMERMQREQWTRRLH